MHEKQSALATFFDNVRLPGWMLLPSIITVMGVIFLVTHHYLSLGVGSIILVAALIGCAVSGRPAGYSPHWDIGMPHQEKPGGTPVRKQPNLHIPRGNIMKRCTV